MDGTLAVKKIAGNIWTFNESVYDEALGKVRPQVDAYLITGSERALVVDALLEDTSLYAKVRELTALPVDVLVSHGHRDHAGTALKDFHEAGCDMYLDKADFSMLSHGLEPSWFKPLSEGMIFDAGGYSLETLMVPGHTPGSAVFLERGKRHLYTGDATGAGVFWMQVPGALPLRELRKNLARLWDQVKDMDDLVLFPGHRHQAPVQLGLEFLADTLLTTDKIISGEWPGKEAEMVLGNGRPIRYRTVAYKLIRDYAYNPGNI